jgi:hypothetical protein
MMGNLLFCIVPISENLEELNTAALRRAFTPPGVSKPRSGHVGQQVSGVGAAGAEPPERGCRGRSL